jgi:hypothetical protein
MLGRSQMNHRVFISYAGAQQAYAKELCEVLEADDIRCWIASRDARAGSDWVDAIPLAVEQAELVLVLLSPEALVSDWVDRELNWAVKKGRPLLPVALGDSEPTPRLNFLFGTIQRSRLRDPPSDADFGRLVVEVRGLLGDRRRARDSVSEAEPAHAPQRDDPFEHRVTEARRAYFVLLVDHSGSMNRRIGDPGTGSRRRARELVADVVNDFLYQLLQTSRRADGYRHFFDVSILGYGLGETRRDVLSQLPDGEDRMAVPSLYGRWREILTSERVQQLPGGRTATIEVKRPIWVEPTPGRGRTVMAEAFWRAETLVESWIVEHPDAFPPVVLNITDGGWTGEDPLGAVRSLQEQATSLGPALVFNCQLAGAAAADGGRQLLFPSEDPADYGRRTRELFLLSSVLPASMRDEARARGLDVGDEARGLVFNASPSRLVDFLQVGTQTLV